MASNDFAQICTKMKPRRSSKTSPVDAAGMSHLKNYSLWGNCSTEGTGGVNRSAGRDRALQTKTWGSGLGLHGSVTLLKVSRMPFDQHLGLLLNSEL